MLLSKQVGTIIPNRRLASDYDDFNVGVSQKQGTAPQNVYNNPES